MNRNNNYLCSQVLHKGYKICEKIGSGGMSEVFRGKNDYLKKCHNKPLAIKLLKPEFFDCDTALYSLETEFLLTQYLKHDSIVKVFDFVVSNQNTFLVMELIEGINFNKINTSNLYKSFQDRIALVLAIVESFAYVHSHFVVHGDIKPSNILISNYGTIKIIDFGLGASPSREPSYAAYAVSLKYSSPERLVDGKISYKDDVYALGCIAHQLLSGSHPLDNFTSLKAMSENKHPKKIDGLDLKMQNILNKMLSFDPAYRPENAQEVLSQMTKNNYDF